MDLFDYLTPATTILTPNRRLSAALLKRYNQQQIDLDKSCWPSLSILPFPSFVQQLWQTYTETQIEKIPALLTPNQEQILWEEILRSSAQGDYLLQLSSTAELAKAAWNILKLWQVDINNPALATTEDSMIFLQWAQQFQNLCQENNWLDTSSVTEQIITKIQTGKIKPAARYVLTGFTEISPLNKSLLSACETAGSEIIHYETPNTDSNSQRLALHNEDAEIELMARWAKSLWEKDPAKSIGCVFPRLEDIREKVIKTFTSVFADAGTYSLQHTRFPFNISAGRNLSLYPVINTALELLALPVDYLTTEVLGHILQSPFIGEAETEMLTRAQFNNALKRANLARVSLNYLLTDNRLNLKTQCSSLAKRFEEYKKLKIKKKDVKPVSEWIETFMRQLNCLGWPGERSLNSEEYQVVDSWLKLLIEYAAFDKVLKPVNYHEALHYLIYLTSKKIFQPESPDAAIQILGLLEATEYPFDYLWVMGLDDSLWPPSPKPNPFIPQRLQKTLQMPHATAERELAYCQQLTAQLRRGAPQVIFSYPQHNDDAELRPSPIITVLPEMRASDLTLTDFIAPARLLYANKALEPVCDEIAPALISSAPVRGGTSIFKLQAACPFKAFAELRLHARKIDPLTPGLSPSERGDVLHKALEILWLRMGDSETLHNMDAGKLQELIKDAVDQALIFVSSEVLLNLRYRKLESERLLRILTEWFEHEKTRNPFKVAAIEKEYKITIANITFSVRVDRIDELENGKKVIIDYKTGKNAKVKHWFGARPEEPQLPLYCTLDPANITGLLFAQINSEEMTFLGISEMDLGVKKIKPLAKVNESNAIDWPDQIRQWNAALQSLANDFTGGVARVDPKKPQETCKNCHLHAVCRIGETHQEVFLND